MAIYHKTVAEKGDLLTSNMWNEEHVIEDFTIKGLHIDNEQIGTDHLINGSVTEEKLADSSVSPAKLKADNSPTDGYVPSYASATGNFLWLPFPTALNLLQKAEVTSTTGTWVIENLNLPSDRFYLIYFHVRNRTDVDSLYYMFPNGVTGPTYESYKLKWDGTNVTTTKPASGSTTYALLGEVGADCSLNGIMYMFLRYVGGGIYMWHYIFHYIDKDGYPAIVSGRNVTGGFSTVTSLEIWGMQGNDILPGSYALIYGYKE